MNCTNCGAAMELVESRRFFRCGHCGSYHFPDSVEADGIRIVGQTAGALQCPVCAVLMVHAVLDERHPIDFCTRCRGFLAPRTTFVHVSTMRRSAATTPPVDPIPFERQELGRALSCPKCGGRFETYPHFGPGNVVVDNCTACDLIWLDFGEMRKIVDAPGRDRGVKPVQPTDDGVARRTFAYEDDDEDDRRTRRSGPADPLSFLLDAIFGD